MPHTVINRLILYWKNVSDAFDIAECYEIGKYINKDLNTAISFYLKAGQQGNAEGYLKLGHILRQKNDPQFIVAYFHASHLENTEAQGLLENCASEDIPKAVYYYGAFMESRDAGKAIQAYRKAIAAYKDPEAMYRLAKLLNASEESINLLYDAAIAGYLIALDRLIEMSVEYPEAKYRLAKIFEQGISKKIKTNISRAVEYYHVAASKGHKASAYRLGCLYREGNGEIAKNLLLASQYYLIAAGEGDQDAILALKEILDTVNDLESRISFIDICSKQQKFSEAASWCVRILSEYPNSEGMISRIEAYLKIYPEIAFKVGMAYEQGEVLKPNLLIACKYYSMAKIEGHAQSIDRIDRLLSESNAIGFYANAVFYYLVKGLLDEAITDLLKADNLGYGEAFVALNTNNFSNAYLYLIAEHYKQGNLVPVNYEVAVDFYVKAIQAKHVQALSALEGIAEQGYLYARYHLAFVQYHYLANQSAALRGFVSLSVIGDEHSKKFLKDTKLTESECLEVAKIYQDGDGICKNAAASIQYYKRAIALNNRNADSEFKLALLYAENHPNSPRAPQAAFQHAFAALEIEYSLEVLDLLNQLKDELGDSYSVKVSEYLERHSQGTAYQVTLYSSFQARGIHTDIARKQHLLHSLNNGQLL